MLFPVTVQARGHLLRQLTSRFSSRTFSSMPNENKTWDSDPRFQAHKNVGPDTDIGAQVPRSKKRFGMGPYAGGRFFVSPSEDPQSFVTNLIIVGLFIYGVMQLPPVGESLPVRRRRIIKERIRQEYGLPVGWDDEIEGEDSDLTSGTTVDQNGTVSTTSSS